MVDDLWPFGFHQLGELTFDSAAYTARYVTKKITGRKADDHYTRLDKSTGELVPITPEFATMSNRPGIGHDWFMRYWRDVYPSDQVIVNGHPSKPPRYYDQLLERIDPEMLREVKRRRAEKADPSEEEWDRLAAKREVMEARSNLYQGRTYEA